MAKLCFMNTDHIELFVDPISPYAWIALNSVSDWQQRTGKTIVVRPILFAALLNAHGHKGPAEIPAKRDYVFRDIVRRAGIQRLNLKGPPTHPFNPLLALRAATTESDDRKRGLLLTAFANAAWSDGLDISDSDVVAAITAKLGYRDNWLTESVNNSRVKEELKDQTENAISAGVFGVPTLKYGKDIFWGTDSIDTLIWTIKGNAIDDAFAEKMLSRGASARRYPNQ